MVLLQVLAKLFSYFNLENVKQLRTVCNLWADEGGKAISRRKNIYISLTPTKIRQWVISGCFQTMGKFITKYQIRHTLWISFLLMEHDAWDYTDHMWTVQTYRNDYCPLIEPYLAMTGILVRVLMLETV